MNSSARCMLVGVRPANVPSKMMESNRDQKVQAYPHLLTYFVADQYIAGEFCIAGHTFVRSFYEMLTGLCLPCVSTHTEPNDASLV